MSENKVEYLTGLVQCERMEDLEALSVSQLYENHIDDEGKGIQKELLINKLREQDFDFLLECVEDSFGTKEERESFFIEKRKEMIDSIVFEQHSTTN